MKEKYTMARYLRITDIGNMSDEEFKATIIRILNRLEKKRRHQ